MKKNPANAFRKGYRYVKNEVEGGHTHFINVKTGVCVFCKCKIRSEKK